MQASKFEMQINLKTAKKLGLAISPDVLRDSVGEGWLRRSPNLAANA